MKVVNASYYDSKFHLVLEPENVKEAELMGGAAASLSFEPQEQAALDIEALALALGFKIPAELMTGLMPAPEAPKVG